MCDREQSRVKLCCRGAGVEGPDTWFHSLGERGVGSSELPHRGHWRNLSVIHPVAWTNDTCLVGGRCHGRVLCHPSFYMGVGVEIALGVAYYPHVPVVVSLAMLLAVLLLYYEIIALLCDLLKVI